MGDGEDDDILLVWVQDDINGKLYGESSVERLSKFKGMVQIDLEFRARVRRRNVHV
jgi:hypothetical protein